MSFIPHALEEWQTRYENEVPHNLAGAGVVPISLRDVIDDQSLPEIQLGYPEVIGTSRLRELVSTWYDCAASDVIIVAGAAEAAFVAITALVEHGDQVISIEPGFRHMSGCAVNSGAEVTTVSTRFEHSWRIDLEMLAAAVTARTKMITLVNPNNPSGVVLTEAEMAAVVGIAERVGAWLVVDEACRGTELEAAPSTFAGRYERAVCLGSLSKPFAAPGLRIGWVIGPPNLLETAQRRHEYTTIATGILSMRLAEAILSEPLRGHLLDRSRRHARESARHLMTWIDEADGLLSVVRPEATTAVLVRYHFGRLSLDVAEQLRTEAGVLVAPGSMFGAEGFLRVAYGPSSDGAWKRLMAGLRRMD